MWQLMAMRQLGPAISDGVGAGWFHIGWTPSASSDGTFHSQNFFVLTPLSIAVSPLRLLLPQNRKGSDLITVYFDELFLHGSRTARDFSPDSTSAFKMGGIDAVPSISINIDFLELKNLF